MRKEAEYVLTLLELDSRNIVVKYKNIPKNNPTLNDVEASEKIIEGNWFFPNSLVSIEFHTDKEEYSWLIQQNGWEGSKRVGVKDYNDIKFIKKLIKEASQMEYGA